MIFGRWCNSFKKELLEAIHDFTTGGDTFKLALYTSTASLGSDTTAYSATNEVADDGVYSAGGNTLTVVDPVIESRTAIVDFADSSWSGGTFTGRGGLIYNSSKANRAVLVLDFGGDVTGTVANGFTVTFPNATSLEAIIRISD